MHALVAPLEAALTDALGGPVRVRSLEPVGGGCINDTLRAQTDAGSFFVKANPAAPPGFFAGERAGLEALAAVPGGLPVPRVVALLATPAALVLEDLGAGRPVRDFEAAVGEGLARQHLHTAPAFGFAVPTYCGLTRQDNTPTATWLEFYRDRRLRPLLRLLAQRGALDPAARALFDRLLDRLPDHLGPADEPPALLHGDLWSGNLHTRADGRPALVDPAAAFGHREAELGMMVLFGGFGPRVFAAYEGVRPLAPGWRERLPLYSLYHVLNHAVLFGGGYLGHAVGLARRFVS
ncbi:fructosamine kinase family protein [Myxococcota bacterium]|nr:fructosamine kinase family protein [Myxococcota bacterium]